MLRVLTAYLHRQDIAHQQFSDELVTLLSTQSGFDLVCFVGQAENLRQAHQWMTEGPIRERLSQATANAIDTTTYFVSFDGTARRCTVTHCRGSCDLPNDFLPRLRRASLLQIFRESDALVDAPHGTHYEKPSGKHTQQFVRVARVLESNLNVSEVAFWLLPTIANCASISCILVDTSGILAVAYVLAYEAVRHKWVDELPIVMSHNSYQGLASLHIRDPASAVCLISASTSGELEECLSKRGIPDTKISTLYLLGSRTNDIRDVLCDLTYNASDNPHGYPPVATYPGDACKLCDWKSLPVRVSGDQFVLEQPIVKQIDILKSDLTQRSLLDAFAATGLFKVFRTTDAEQFEIYLDVETLFAPKLGQPSDSAAQTPSQYQPTAKLEADLRDRFNAYVRRGLPVHAKRIVHGAHVYSAELAQAAEQTFRQFQDSSPLLVLKAQDLPSAEKVSETATLVLGSCFTGARELMTINMLLRGVQPRGNTTYVALIFRSETKVERDRVRNNITFGEFDAETFNFYAATNLYLPNCARTHSWQAELEMLIAIEHRAQLEGLDVPAEIDNRIEALRAAPRRGLEDNLFWPSAANHPLRIQHDFVFIDTKERLKRISQADIYVVMASLLHDLRQRTDDRQLVHGPYKRAVVAPDNFRRFNDPIVQAAILRAARGHELSYANCTDSISMGMKLIIEEQIASAASGKAECLMEFLLALCTKRLTLHRDHVTDLCSTLFRAGLPSAYCMVTQYLASALSE